MLSSCVSQLVITNAKSVHMRRPDDAIDDQVSTRKDGSASTSLHTPLSADLIYSSRSDSKFSAFSHIRLRATTTRFHRDKRDAYGRDDNYFSKL